MRRVENEICMFSKREFNAEFSGILEISQPVNLAEIKTKNFNCSGKCSLLRDRCGTVL